MSWLFIEPSDVWLFRDSRPFAAGEGHGAESIYPPAPFTVQGALRSWLLGQAMVDWRAFREQSDQAAQAMAARIGHPPRAGVAGSLGAFVMRGPFRARLAGDRAEILYPTPLDIYHVEKGQWRALRPAKTKAVMDWGEGFSPLLPDPADPNEKPDEEPGATLTHNSFLDYLDGRRFGLLAESELVGEPRLGIAMDYDAGRAADSMLYTAEFARLRPPTGTERYGLLVDMGDGLDWPDQGVIALGGEARAALVRKLAAAEAPEAIVSKPAGNRFKIVLQTPAWFDEGRQPQGGDWASFFAVPATAKLRCVAAAVGRPSYFGGWDAARGGHKPLRGFVPPGSVFYFEAEQPLALPHAFTQTPLDEQTQLSELDFAAQGLGAFVAGSWQWLAE